MNRKYRAFMRSKKNDKKKGGTEKSSNCDTPKAANQADTESDELDRLDQNEMYQLLTERPVVKSRLVVSPDS